jgi:hypothetical protein
MTNAKLQKEINSIAKLNMIEGELYIVGETKANSNKEVETISEKTLSEIEIPEGFKKSENLLYRKGLKIYISFTK